MARFTACRCADSIDARWRESDAESGKKGKRNGDTCSREFATRWRLSSGHVSASKASRVRIWKGVNEDRARGDPRWASVVASGKSLNPLVSRLPLCSFFLSFFFPSSRNRDEFLLFLSSLSFLKPLERIFKKKKKDTEVKCDRDVQLWRIKREISVCQKHRQRECRT